MDKFKNAVRKVTVLNRRRELKPFKLFELINYIKMEKRKEALAEANNKEERDKKLADPNFQILPANNKPTKNTPHHSVVV